MPADDAVVLHVGRARCEIDPTHGGRVASLVVDGTEVLVRGDDARRSDPLRWGCYPMAPWAGRVRFGRFRFAGRDHQLECNLPPHAIHGTVLDRPWRTVFADSTTVELDIALGSRWPLGGRAFQRIELRPDRLRCSLAVQAADQPMPAQVGWHPWFVKPDRAELRFARMYQRDGDGIPSGVLVTPPEGPWDDCFVEPLAPLRLVVGPVTLTISSDCDHWVVYDEPADATCVEPQSGPPDGFTLRPHVLGPGDTLERWMEIAWTDPRRTQGV